MGVRFCTLASGSSGNCHLISDQKNHYLIDAGLSGKQIEKRLEEIDIQPSQLKGILITHEHVDHIQGAGILSRRYNLPIYANDGTWLGMEKKIGEIKEANRCYFHSDTGFELGNFQIMPYGISHDANEPVGFSFHHGKVKISIATDLGYMTEAIKGQIQGSDLLVLEANHDEEMLKAGRYPYYLKRRILSDVGHLSNHAAGQAVIDLLNKNIGAILLAHLSQENNFPELAMATVQSILHSNQAVVGQDIHLEVANRDKISRPYEFA